MIKVNLARPESLPVDGEGTSIASPGLSLDLSGLKDSFNSSLGLKLALIFIFPLGVYLWEGHHLKGIRAEFNNKNSELQVIKTEVSQYGSAAVAIEEIQRERKVLKDRIAVIGQISSKRAFKIQTLSSLQKIIPGDCWLRQIDINKKQIVLKGYARTASSVQSLVEQMGKFEFLSQVVNEGMTRKALGESIVSEFNIVAQVKEN